MEWRLTSSLRHRRKARALLMLACAAPTGLAAPPAQAIADRPAVTACSALAVPVRVVSPPPTAYREFCHSRPADCRLRGPAVLAADDSVRQRLRGVNAEVNAEVRFVPDIESTGEEEVWRYPERGRGDCEDSALEKRRRLVASGLPSAALTMAIVHHRARLFSHAVLLAETAEGTLMLDSLTDELMCWSRAPYNFETRERPDGRWDRFDQSVWVYEPLHTASSAEPCASAPR